MLEAHFADPATTHATRPSSRMRSREPERQDRRCEYAKFVYPGHRATRSTSRIRRPRYPIHSSPPLSTRSTPTRRVRCAPDAEPSPASRMPRSPTQNNKIYPVIRRTLNPETRSRTHRTPRSSEPRCVNLFPSPYFINALYKTCCILIIHLACIFVCGLGALCRFTI